MLVQDSQYTMMTSSSQSADKSADVTHLLMETLWIAHPVIRRSPGIPMWCLHAQSGPDLGIHQQQHNQCRYAGEGLKVLLGCLNLYRAPCAQAKLIGVAGRLQHVEGGMQAVSLREVYLPGPGGSGFLRCLSSCSSVTGLLPGCES